MINKPIMAIALSVVATLFFANSVYATQTLPFADSFESFSVAAPYTTNGTGIVVGQSVTTLSNAGATSLVVSNDTLNLAILDGFYSNVWVQIYAKPVTGAADPIVTGSSGAFYVNDSGTIRVYNGFTSVWADGGTVTPGEWVGFVAHVDYDNRKWDLYTAQGAYLSVATKVASFLGMAVTYDDMEQFSVQSGEACFIDGLAVSEGGEDVTAASPNRVAVASFSGGSTPRDFVLPVYSAAWTNSVADRALTGALGAALKSGLLPLERIYIAGTNAWTWDQYYVTGPGPWAVHGSTPNAAAPSGQYIFENTRLQCRLVAARIPATTFGFFAYDDTSVMALNGVSGPGAAGKSIAIRLNGTNENPGGFTGLGWTDTLPIASLPFGLTELDHGDRLFVAFPSNPNSYREYWWQEGVGRWMDFATVPSVSIPSGSKFWVRRGAATLAEVNHVR